MLKAYIRRGFAVSMILTLLLAITGCASAPVNSGSGEQQPIKLIFATDLHFYAPELIGDFERFSRELEQGDGKVVQYSHEIIQALIDTVLREKPAALLLGGDLSLNGEYESHRKLADMLKPVYDAGIPVLTVPGNHDINSLSAFSYADGDACAGIDENGFSELYSKLGINNAISKDKESLSYMYAIKKDLYLLMLDTCDYDGIGRSTGSVSEKTMKWIERQLKGAQKAGAKVISVSHHNLLQHSSLWAEPFLMTGSAELVSLLEHYGVELNLTGHMHIQHMVRPESPGGLSEAATGSLLVSPNYYGTLNIGADSSISYSVKSLDVSGWAKSVGNEDENLLDFLNYSQAFFDTTSRSKRNHALEGYQMSSEDLAHAVDFAVLINRHYFAGTVGTVRDELLQHPGYALWQEKNGQEFFAAYMDSMLNDMTTGHTSIILE